MLEPQVTVRQNWVGGNDVYLYHVQSTRNLIIPRLHDAINEEALEQLMKDGVNVVIEW